MIRTLKSLHAFTLIELAIVLVIIGLLVGGVLAGRTLIHNAELQNITISIDRYSAAIYTFRERYGGWPGDFDKASNFISGCTDGYANPCNGGGDESIAFDDSCNIARSLEIFRVWYHLQKVGLVTGNYDLANYACNDMTYFPNNYRPGENSPMLKLRNGIMIFESISVGNQAFRGFAVGPSNRRIGLLTPMEGQALDSKIDDGFYESGNFQGAEDHPLAGTPSCRYISGGHNYWTADDDVNVSCVFTRSFK